MKKTFIVANWKSNKTLEEARSWLNAIGQFSVPEEKEIVVCPSFVHFSLMKAFIEEQKLPIKLGAQNISPFDQGAYTGEVSAKQVRELAEYVIIGHSERRKYFGETEDLLSDKVKMANKFGLKAIFCADNEESFIPAGVAIVTYEPPTSISPAPPDTPENAGKAAKKIKDKTSIGQILYGGNVTSENVSSFTRVESISGVLVGRASLDAQEFYKIIKNA